MSEAKVSPAASVASANGTPTKAEQTKKKSDKESGLLEYVVTLSEMSGLIL